MAVPEIMPAEPKYSIKALRDGGTNKRTRETKLLKSKSSPRYSTSDQPDYLADRTTIHSNEGYNNERQNKVTKSQPGTQLF
jgi:hypothetical protein